MKSIVAYIRARRWCQILLAVLVLFFATLLHPRGREIIFNRINGWTRTRWETEIRTYARREWDVRPDPWYIRYFDMIGVRFHEAPIDLRDPRLVPIVMDLAEDDDAQVRRYCLYWLDDRRFVDGPTVIPIFRAHLKDSDANCRLTAATALLNTDHRNDAKATILELAKDPDPGIRCGFIHVVTQFGWHVPELLDAVVELAEDSSTHVRRSATYAVLKRTAKPRISLVRRALQDRDDANMRLEGGTPQADWESRRVN